MLAYSFMRHAFLAGTIIAIVCGLVSYFVVIRRMAFAAHALGHISMTGAAGAVLAGLNPMVGFLVLNVISAILMGALGDRIRKNDLAVGIVLTFFLGMGAWFLFLYRTGYSGGVMAILFGDILSVSMNQVYLLCLLALIVIAGLLTITRPLLFSSIDPTLATAKRIPLRLLSILFFIILAVTVSMACQIVGALLIFAMLIGPGAVSVNLCDGFYKSIGISVAVSMITVWLSLAASWYLNLPASFCITMLICIFYSLSAIRGMRG